MPSFERFLPNIFVRIDESDAATPDTDYTSEPTDVTTEIGDFSTNTNTDGLVR